MVEITAEQIQRVELILQNVPKGAERALANAINRGISKAETVSVREIRSTYTVDSPTAHGSIQQKKASVGNIVGSIIYAGSPIPLIKYDVSPTGKTGHRQRVAARVLKSSGRTSLKYAFNRSFNSGALRTAERIGRSRLPIKVLYGPSLAQMAENEQVLPKAEEEAQKVVDERIEHEIWRLISGYGG